MKMKAAYMSGFGGAQVLEFGELEKPQPQAGEVLVRIEAAGVNYYDVLVRSGAVSQDIPLPHIPGADAVGVVEALGEGATRFEEGDPVILAPGFPVDPAQWDAPLPSYQSSYYPGGTFNQGSYAQYMSIHERWLLPNDIDMPAAELACIPLVLVTAVHSVKTAGGVGPGQRVLVHAGASGSGAMAIEVAKALGAEVITTVSTDEKAALARRMGADEVVLYRDTDFVEAARAWSGGGVDVVIDCVGGEVFAKSLEALRWGGTLVNLGLVAGVEVTIPHLYPFFRGQYQIRGAYMGSMEELREGLAWLREGKIRGALDEALPLSEARAVHERLERHGVNGKLVLLPWA